MKFKSITESDQGSLAYDIRDVAFSYLKQHNVDFGIVVETGNGNWRTIVRRDDFRIHAIVSDMEEVRVEIFDAEGTESQFVFMIGKSGDGDNGMKYAVIDFACAQPNPAAMGCLKAVALFVIRKFQELALDERAVYGMGRARSLVHAL